MAPELDGYFRNTYTVSRYSVSVDIWALGVITMELLLKHPFPYPSDQYEYIQDTKLLRFDDFSGVSISKPCQDFVRSLLAPNPVNRPTADAAISHPWLTEVALPVHQEDSSVFNAHPVSYIHPTLTNIQAIRSG